MVLQWIEVLTPPGVWSVWFLANYNLAESLACSPGAIRFLVPPGMQPVILLNTALAAALTILTGLLSLRDYRRVRASDATTGRRASWMALSGVMLSALFLLIIVGGFFTVAMLNPPCAPSM
ncbi:MAG: hypothetical protein NVSMB32_06590 [Actinomycetota bacterium]